MDLHEIKAVLNSVGSHHHADGFVPINFPDDGFGNGVFGSVKTTDVYYHLQFPQWWSFLHSDMDI